MNVLFLHGAGNPEADDGSFVLLRRLMDEDSLETERVIAPILPKPDAPDSAEWVAAISDHITRLEAATTIITHSLGGSCCLHALASQPPSPYVRHLILVAAPHWGTDPDWSAASFVLPDHYHKDLHWIETIDLVYSNSDEIVPIQHMSLYQSDLPRARTHVISDSNHTFRHGDLAMLIALLKKYCQVTVNG